MEKIMKDIICNDANDDCIFESIGSDKISQALSLISGKWKLKLLYIIGYHETIRYGVLKRQATPITHKMLNAQLKELEADGLITRTEYPQIPPRVEYSLSKLGDSMRPVIKAMEIWGTGYQELIKSEMGREIKDAQQR
jgi:DNA-binding HxlR family transcriptional regulator